MFRCEKYVLDSVRNDIDSSSYLLNVFTSIDTYAGENWAACARFLIHLRWHKPRGTILSQKINKDPWNKGDFGPHKEGTQQARETLEIYRQLGTTVEQAKLLDNLAWLLHKDVRVDAAKDAASHWQSVSSRRRVGILRPPSQSRLLSDGTRSCSGFITPLRSAFSTNASFAVPRLTSDESSHTQSRTHGIWPTRCSCRLAFGFDNADSKRPSPRLCMLLGLLRNSGQRGIY